MYQWKIWMSIYVNLKLFLIYMYDLCECIKKNMASYLSQFSTSSMTITAIQFEVSLTWIFNMQSLFTFFCSFVLSIIIIIAFLVVCGIVEHKKKCLLVKEVVSVRMSDIQYYMSDCKSMMSPLLEMDKFGWLGKDSFLRKELEIAELKGFVIDWNDGQTPLIKVYYKPAKNGNGLLSISDLKTMLMADPKEVKKIIFSLDRLQETYISNNQPNRVFYRIPHVFKKRFSPSKFANTGIMDTLFYADYILKFLAVGNEVSAKYPFEVRPVNHLIQHLPHELQYSLRPPHLRQTDCKCVCCPRRFWIEVKQIDFESQLSDEKEVYYINSVETKVNTECMGTCPSYFRDTSFAEDLTSHFDELSQYFPIFSRLTEIAKLQFIITTCHERLAARGYQLSLATSNEDEIKGLDSLKQQFVPSAFNMKVTGGVQMVPTYIMHSSVPLVDDTPLTYSNSVSTFTGLAQKNHEKGIRLQVEGKLRKTDDIKPLLTNFEAGLSSLDLAMIASLLILRSTEKKTKVKK